MNGRATCKEHLLEERQIVVWARRFVQHNTWKSVIQKNRTIDYRRDHKNKRLLGSERENRYSSGLGGFWLDVG